MANPEHLKILKQGVKAWNKWRKGNPRIKPDLSNADLHGAKLGRMNLSGANLRGIDLCEAKLGHSNLSHTDLHKADLHEADLHEAELNEANLCQADLHDAILHKADLHYANLRKAGLRMANLFNANLWDASLRSANLSDAEIFDADLSLADGEGADLSFATLVCTKFRSAHLTNADLRWSGLIKADLTGAELTGAKLYGSARDDWIIDDVKCRYVYWDEKGEQRSPKDRDLEPGEFERLYAALPTIEYIFEHGMSPIDPLIMDRVVQAIREKRPEFDIKIDSINARGLAPSIKFTVQQEEHKKPALQQVQKEYEIKLKQLESERDRYYQLLARALDAPKEVKLINAGPGAIVATDGSTINIQQHIHNALELQKTISAESEESESFTKIAKKTALDIIGGAIKDIAKGQVKEAAKQIVELGKDLGPIIAKTAAYTFFSSMVG